MNDPHVKRLYYRLKLHPDGMLPPLNEDTELFQSTWNYDLLILELKANFVTVEEAQSRIDGYFKAKGLEFIYKGADIVDRKPSLPLASRSFPEG